MKPSTKKAIANVIMWIGVVFTLLLLIIPVIAAIVFRWVGFTKLSNTIEAMILTLLSDQIDKHANSHQSLFDRSDAVDTRRSSMGFKRRTSQIPQHRGELP